MRSKQQKRGKAAPQKAQKAHKKATPAAASKRVASHKGRHSSVVGDKVKGIKCGTNYGEKAIRERMRGKPKT